jgi:hypothetical protein
MTTRMESSGRPSSAVLLVLGVLAMLGIGLLFAIGRHPEAEGDAAGSPFSGRDASSGSLADDVELALDPALDLDPGPTSAAREASSAPAEAAAREEGTGVAAPEADAAIVRGTLRDAGTEEPLPLYALRIRDAEGRREDLMTDERGRFATGSPMASGLLRVIPFDEPGHQRRLGEIVVDRRVEDGEAPDLALSVPCGPTYRFAITPRAAVVPTTLVARLRIRSPDDVRQLGPEPVRAGDPPWVRFAPVPEDFEACDRIELRSRDGQWLGSANASILAGVAPGRTGIELDSRAVLAGRVLDEAGGPVRGAAVLFEGETPSGRDFQRRASTRADGSFRFEVLFDGVGTLSVRSLRYGPRTTSIRLVAGATTQQDFLLVPLPAAGAVSGRIESETGTYEGKARVVLRPRALLAFGERLPDAGTADVRWEERSGRRVGVFEFTALPAGEYELSLRDGSWFAKEPRTLLVSPPNEAARFLVRDDLALGDFAFRPRDGETGAPLARTFAWWDARGAAREGRQVDPDEVFLARFPIDRGFRWRLDRAGYRPAFGDAQAFALEELRGGRVRKIAEVDLVPGWGEVFRVVRRGDKKPVGGVKILLDGREAGATKKDGTCLVTAREKPARVEIDYRGWIVRSGVDLRPAWKRKEKRFVQIEIGPKPR